MKLRELDKLKASDFKDVDDELKKEIYKLFQVCKYL